MRLHILDDLHLEFGKFNHIQPDCDVVILSGDIGPGVAGVMWAQDTFDVPVIYVPGNHEFYGRRKIGRHVEKMKAKAAGSNVHVLQNEALVIDGVRFLGATLWTDFDLYGNAPFATMFAQQRMNDYEQIETDGGSKFTAFLSTVEHMASRQFLREEFEKPFEGKTVVVSHHAPSELSVPEHYAGYDLNPAYASRLEPIMLEHEPVLWTHGHIHSNSDYMVGKTRVICNPRGYVGHELNPGFDPSLVIEI